MINRLKMMIGLGVVVFYIGLIGECIYYGEAYEVMMWAGLTVCAVCGAYGVYSQDK